MPKRILNLFLFLILVLSLGSCKKDPKPTPKPEPTEFEYKTTETDKLKLTQDYAGKDFIEDGIGEVTVTQFIDGDTTIFRSKSGKTFTARYSGINTPESTYKVEPWGFAASGYTKQVLKDATKIVCQAEDMDERTDPNGRYFTWVWTVDANGDTRLLNLELCELAYAFNKANSTEYESQFAKAVYDAQIARVRIYGEEDPDYDYSPESKIMTLKEIKDTYGTVEAIKAQKGKGTKVKVTGVVSRMNGGNSCYIQQYDVEADEYYGIYVYGAFQPHKEFKIGNTVIFEATIGFYSGSLQLTGLKNLKVKQFADTQNPESNVNKYDITDLSVLTITNTEMLGRLVIIHDVVVTGGKNPTSDSNAFTIYVQGKLPNGQTKQVEIRVDGNVTLRDPETNDRILSWEYFEGKSIKSLIAICSYFDYSADDGSYDGFIQLMLTQISDIEYAE